MDEKTIHETNLEGNETTQELTEATAQSTEVTTDKSSVDTVKEESSKGNKPSYWVMILSLIVFFTCGGVSYCPWYMWIVVTCLILGTIGGMDKKVQAIMGIAILIWGTPVFSDNKHDEFSDSGRNSSYLISTTESDIKKDVTDVLGTWSYKMYDPDYINVIEATIRSSGTGTIKQYYIINGGGRRTLINEEVTFRRDGNILYAKFPTGAEAKFIVKNGHLFTVEGQPYTKE